MAAIIVLTTTASKREANKIAESLVGAELAACVNILPRAESIYVWEGKKCRSSEYLLMIKTQKKHFLRLEKAIRKLHSYEVPEIIAIPVVAGSKPYIEWLCGQT